MVALRTDRSINARVSMIVSQASRKITAALACETISMIEETIYALCVRVDPPHGILARVERTLSR